MTFVRFFAMPIGAALVAGCTTLPPPGACDDSRLNPDPALLRADVDGLADRLAAGGFQLDDVKDDGTLVVVVRDFCRPPIQPNLDRLLAKARQTLAAAPLGASTCNKPPVVIATACMLR